VIIEIKLKGWNRQTLSIEGRFQVCQQILSTYIMFYASMWLFSNLQIECIQKVIKAFLWSDGKGKSKRHYVNWKWCYVGKELGGFGLKDLKLQGMALLAKWTVNSLEGNEP